LANEISLKFRYGRRLVAEIGTIFEGGRLALEGGVRLWGEGALGQRNFFEIPLRKKACSGNRNDFRGVGGARVPE